MLEDYRRDKGVDKEEKSHESTYHQKDPVTPSLTLSWDRRSKVRGEREDWEYTCGSTNLQLCLLEYIV